MNKKHKFSILLVILGAFIAVAVVYLHHVNIPILNPKGTIAAKEQHLIYIALLLSIIVVIPVFTLLFTFAWKYRATNTTASYSPDLDHNAFAETLWWLIPGALITVLSIITWNSSHALDPYKPITSKTPEMTIQVVALDWKWLFIYPSQHIATVNYVQIPVNTPIKFQITSDAPMNSFWVPQLGGQIYAMPGMSTELHLMATSMGNFYGSSANISGVGFSGMNFRVTSTSNQDFMSWVRHVKGTVNPMDFSIYDQVAKPSQNATITYYSSVSQGLYDTIVNKYMNSMTPTQQSSPMILPSQTSMQGMEM